MIISTTVFGKSFTLGLLTLAVASLTPAMADFQLDNRYQDSDSDLIADIPSNESEWRNPSTLVFAYTPVEDPAVYADVWSEFLAHMEAETGKRVQFFPVQSNAAQIEAMRAGLFCLLATQFEGAGSNRRQSPLIGCGE